MSRLPCCSFQVSTRWPGDSSAAQAELAQNKINRVAERLTRLPRVSSFESFMYVSRHPRARGRNLQRFTWNATLPPGGEGRAIEGIGMTSVRRTGGISHHA